MLKIKYKLITEVKNTYQIPIEEEVEKTVEKENPREVNGEIVMETVRETITETVVTGYEEKEEVTQIFTDKAIPWSEENEEFAKAEAYNGEYTVEDDGEPDPAVPTNDDSAVWNELDKAYEEGYDEGYKEGVDNAYDE